MPGQMPPPGFPPQGLPPPGMPPAPPPPMSMRGPPHGQERSDQVRPLIVKSETQLYRT